MNGSRCFTGRGNTGTMAPRGTPMVDSLRKRFQWFLAHAGGIVGQHAATSLALARAEAWLEEEIDEERMRVTWEPDEHADLSWADKEDRRKLDHGYWEVRGCVLERACLECGEWKPVASLWGIVSAFDAQDNYPRIVVTELALEAM